MKKAVKINKRIWIFSAIYSILLSTCCILGIKISHFGTVWISEKNYPFVFLYILIFLIMYAFLSFLPKISEYIRKVSGLSKFQNIFFENNIKSFWYCFAFISLFHIPTILAYFPGVFSYDAYFQIQFFLTP